MAEDRAHDESRRLKLPHDLYKMTNDEFKTWSGKVAKLPGEIRHEMRQLDYDEGGINPS
jgi:hypothetical protein